MASARSRDCGRPRAQPDRTPGWRRSRSTELALVRRGGSRGSQGARGTRRPARRRPWRARRLAAQQLGRVARDRATSASPHSRRPPPRSPREPRARRAPGRRREVPGRRTQGGGGRRSSAVPAGGRCSRSRARCALRLRAGRALGLGDEHVMQLQRACTGRQSERDAKRLASWTAGAQPAGGRPSDSPLELPRVR